jgi:hypothetical protein
VVPETLVAPHALTTATRKHLRTAERGRDGLLQPDRKTCLNIRVTKASLARALLIFDTFIKEWEQLGGKVLLGRKDYENDPVTTVELHEDRVTIELFEETKCVAIDNKAGRHWSFRDWKYEATGKLVFQVGGGRGATRRRWADGQRQRLETLLDSFIGGLIDILEAERLERLDDQCVGRQRAIVREVREAAKRRQELEEGRRKSLSEQVSAWRKAGEIRAYLEALRGKIEAASWRPPVRPSSPSGWTGRLGTPTTSIR